MGNHALECKGNGQPGGEVDWEGRKEGGETGRNRGAAGSGIVNRVETGSGQRKAPRGNLGDAKGESGLLVSRRSLLVH